jgi:hypothetical protein
MNKYSFQERNVHMSCSLLDFSIKFSMNQNNTSKKKYYRNDDDDDEEEDFNCQE